MGSSVTVKNKIPVEIKQNLQLCSFYTEN